MPLVPITQADDARIRDFTDLTDVNLRKSREVAEGLFMAESLPVVQRAVAAGYRVRAVLTEPRWQDQAQSAANPLTPIYVAEPDVLQHITGYRLHRGILAAMQRKPLASATAVLEQARTVLVLDALVNHTNVGAAFRSAAAMGFDAVLTTTTGADPLYRRSVRTSMGTVFAVPWTVVAPEDLWVVLADFDTVALTPAPQAPILAGLVPDLGPRRALILGTEGPGLSPQALAAARFQARIPMAAGVDSLNVAATAALAGYILAERAPG
ncbi:MAG: RNA methyltransferase [Actinomycetia bacterium]|nr:RNA methyltransferase [Actinomycetes bacterium]